MKNIYEKPQLQIDTVYSDSIVDLIDDVKTRMCDEETGELNLLLEQVYMAGLVDGLRYVVWLSN